jgi:tetratricopeptide (TPR) repeat protein
MGGSGKKKIQLAATVPYKGLGWTLSIGLNCFLAVIVAVLVAKQAGTPTLQQRQSQPTPPPPTAAASAMPAAAASALRFNATAVVKVALGKSRAVRARQPLAAIAVLETALEQFPARAAGRGGATTMLSRAMLHEELGDTRAQAKRFDGALAAHREALALRQALQRAGSLRAADLVGTHAQLATDLKQLFRFDEALGALAEAKRAGGEALPPLATAILLRLQASVHECAGDYIVALQTMEQSLKISPPASDRAGLDVRRVHLDLLRRVLQTSESMPAGVRRAMSSFAETQTAALLRAGAWQSAHQLPQHYVRGLHASAWHSLARYPAVARLAQLLEAPATLAALRAEYAGLRAAGALQRERECIHGVGQRQGEWLRFELTGNWQPLDSRGCASDTAPRSCELLRQLRSLGTEGSVPVIRAGFSMLEAGAWLKPHFGMTNGQLKLHLGLQVPEGRCATLRVGNETRAWQRDKVLFFDDSFEHEVWNACGAERVVFQVVFAHPGLAELKSEPSARR